MDYTVRVFDFSTPFLVGNKSSLSALHVNANLERRTEWNTAYTGFRMYRVDHHREWTMQISLQEVVSPPSLACRSLFVPYSLSTTVHSTTSSLRKLPTLCELPLILINVTGVDVAAASMWPLEFLGVYRCTRARLSSPAILASREHSLFLRLLFQISLRFISPADC